MRFVWLVGVLMLGGIAEADERTPSMHLGGGVTLTDTGESDELGPVLDGVGGMRVTIGWEEPPLPYPDQRGYKVGGALVPELVAGALMNDGKAEGMLGAGLRAELRISQREGGLLRLNAKGALYLAGRGMVVGKDRDVLLEGVFGYYLYLGSPVRLGFEVGASQRREPMDERAGVLTLLFLGWGPR